MREPGDPINFPSLIGFTMFLLFVMFALGKVFG